MNQEIIKREAERTSDDRMVLHFYQEGSFYRAYEWSAWLCHRFINQFKVTHRNFKSINSCLRRMKLKILRLNHSVRNFDPSKQQETFLILRSSLNSFLGVMSHYKSRALRTNMMYSMPCFFYYGRFDADVLRYEESSFLFVLSFFVPCFDTIPT